MKSDYAYFTVNNQNLEINIYNERKAGISTHV